MDYKGINLEAIKFRISQNFSKYMIDSMQLNVFEEHLGNAINIEFQTKIFGQHNKQKYTVKIRIPKNWWQHFKRDILPNWYKKIYPVKWKFKKRVIEFDHIALMPDIKIGNGQDKIIMYSKPILEYNENSVYRELS